MNLAMVWYWWLFYAFLAGFGWTAGSWLWSALVNSMPVRRPAP